LEDEGVDFLDRVNQFVVRISRWKLELEDQAGGIVEWGGGWRVEGGEWVRGDGVA